MLRLVVFLGIVVAIFLPLNIIAATQLARIHPRRKALLLALLTICNLMWLFLPWLNARTDFSRFVRALLGPPWFAWLCFVIVYCALLLLIAIAWIPFRHRPFREFARQPSRMFLWGTIAATVIGVYTALVPLDVQRVPIALPDLPPELNGTRIVLLADLHIGLFSRPSRLRQIFETVNGLSPDFVLLAGDLIDDDPVYLSKLLDGARSLAPPTPIIAVLGNHEMYGAPLEVIARLRGSRIHLLVNAGMPVTPSVSEGPGGTGGARKMLVPRQPARPLAGARGVSGLWIAGLSDYAARTKALEPDFDAALAGRPAAAYPIVVSHQPRSFPESIRRRLPLTLCAHSHGGQCGFRPLHWSLAGLFLPYHMGLYQRGQSQLYVNTGTGYWLLPWRLGLLPEITVIELRRR